MRVIHFFLMSLVIVPAFLSCSRGVENKFLVSLIGSGFITRKEARAEDGLRFVLESIEEIVFKLTAQGAVAAEFKDKFHQDFLRWQKQLFAGCDLECPVVCLPVDWGTWDPVRSIGWIKHNVSVPLETVLYEKGFVGSFELVRFFY